MLLRLIPVLGAEAPPVGIALMNDTGSDIMTLFTTDLPYFGPNIRGITDSLYRFSTRWYFFCVGLTTGLKCPALLSLSSSACASSRLIAGRRYRILNI
jgi:hypothetical protein